MLACMCGFLLMCRLLKKCCGAIYKLQALWASVAKIGVTISLGMELVLIQFFVVCMHYKQLFLAECATFPCCMIALCIARYSDSTILSHAQSNKVFIECKHPPIVFEGILLEKLLDFTLCNTGYNYDSVFFSVLVIIYFI